MADNPDENKPKTIAAISSLNFRTKILDLIKEKVKPEEGKDAKEGEAPVDILDQPVPEEVVREVAAKGLEWEARGVKVEEGADKEGGFWGMFEYLKKPEEGKQLSVKQLVDAILKEARACRLAMEPAPKIQCPDSDDEYEPEMLDFYKDIMEGKGALGDLELVSANSATYHVHKMVLGSASKYMLRLLRQNG